MSTVCRWLTSSWRSHALVASFTCLLVSACGTVSSRFDPQIQTAITHADMQRLETEKLILYYPKGTKAETLRIAKRLEYCRRELEKVTPIKNGPAADKSIFILPQVQFNNAFVAPPALSGLQQVAVLPQGNTASYFLYFGMEPDPGIIGCHEMVHDMSFRQISGKAKFLHYALGSGSFSPQIGLESWFQEGIAVYYETKIQGRGRLWTRYFEGVFAAGVQEQNLNGSFLKSNHRKPLFGAQYLVGSHFIDYLARTYGEDKIWDVVGRQSRSILPPFGVGVRFKRSFGKSLSDLIDEFNVYAHKRFPARARPAQQQRVRQLGTMALIGRSSDGHVATLSEDLDQPLRLFVHAPDGRELLSRRLTDVGLGRRLLATNVFAVSGLTLTADGQHVYFVALDAGPVAGESRLVHLDVAKNQLRVIAEDIAGAGGSINADGTKYYYAKGNGDSFAVHVYDVAHHTSKQLTHPGVREYHTYPFVSPDGSRLIVLEGVADAIRPAIYDATTGARLSDVAAPEGATLQPSWRDDQHVVYLASDGMRMQAFETELSTSQYRRLTDAPYVAGAPFFDGKNVLFLNREGWRWTLDQASAEGAGPWFASTTRAVSEGSAAQTALQEIEVAAAPVVQGSGGEAMPTDAQGATTPATGSTGFAAAPQDTGAAVPGSVAAPPTVEGTTPPVAAPPVADPSAPAAPSAATDPADASNGAAQPPATLPASAEAKSETAAASTPAPVDEATTSHAYFEHKPIVEQEPKIVSDEEDYSIFDGLFVPQGIAPWFAQRAEGQQAIGLGLTGGDRLGLQRWALLGGWDFNAKLPSGLLSYQNNMMAPYILQIDAEYIGRSEKKLEGFDPVQKDVRIQEVVGSALLSRTWYSSHTAALGGRYVSTRYESKDGGDLVLSQRFAGPTLALATSSAESTPYSGRRVAFALGAVATYYPEALSKADFNLTDLRGAATVVTPLPISRRHTLTLDGRVRALVGLPQQDNLLQVGGGGNTTLPISLDPDAGPGQQTILPPGLRFFETLRGFEDYALLGRGALMGEATYTYPFIVDWGTASSLRFLPSIFLRQINLDLFFSAASLLDNDRAAALATGAALKAQVLVWQLPLVFTFQESRRLTYDEDFAFYFQVGAQPF